MTDEEPTQPETETAGKRRRLASKATRGRRDGAIWAFVAVMVFQTIVNYNLATTGENLIHKQDVESDAERLADAVGSCERGNVTRAQINVGNDAKAAIADAVGQLRNAIDGIVGVFLAPALDPNADLTVEQRARVEAIRSGVDEQLATVDDALAVAQERIDAARLGIRNCHPDVVLSDPNATVPEGSG